MNCIVIAVDTLRWERTERLYSRNQVLLRNLTS